MRQIKKVLIGIAALAALALGASALAGAATGSSSTTTTTPQQGYPPQGETQQGNAPRGAPRAFPKGEEPGTAAHEAAEKPVTGADAEKAKEAAVKSLGGGTAGEVTTNFFGNGYEVTVTKSDGTKVEVHMDKSFNVMTGPGPGHPGGAPLSGSSGSQQGGFQGPPPGQQAQSA
jgi:hypothetical protein